MDYMTFEELTEAVHDLLWEMELRARRKKPGPPLKGPHVGRVREAVRRAQDVLLP